MSEQILKPFSGQLDNNKDQSTALKPFVGSLDGEKQQEKGFLGHAQDAGVSLLKGVVAVPETLVGLADIPTGGQVGKFIEENTPIQFKQTQDALNDLHTDQYKEQQKQFSEAGQNEDSLVGKVIEKGKVALSNPSMIFNTVVESAPSMLAGGAVGRGLGMASKAIKPIAAGAIGEGAVMAGQQAENIRYDTNDKLLTPEQSGLSIATGALGSLFGLAGGQVVRKLGFDDLETAMASGHLNSQLVGDSIQKMPLSTIPKSIIGGALTEGLLEELPQSVSEQLLQNYALGKPLDEGLDSAIVMGTLAGMAMGGGMNTVSAPVNYHQNNKAYNEQQNAIVQEQQVEADRIANEQQNESQIQYDNGLDFTPTDVDQSKQTEVPQQQAYDNQVNFEPPAPASDSWALGEFQPERVDHGNTINYEHPALNTTEIETGSVSDYVFPTQPKPSEQMGINPNDGPMSTAAALAVDSGITPTLNASNEVASNLQRNDNESLNNAVPSNYQSLLGSNNENSAPIFTGYDQSANEYKSSTFNDSPSDQSTNTVTASENDGISKSGTAQSGVSGANQSTNNESPVGATTKIEQAVSENSEVTADIQARKNIPALNTTGNKSVIPKTQPSESNDIKSVLRENNPNPIENTISSTENSNLNGQNDIDQTQTNNITDQISQLEQQLSEAKTVSEKAKLRKQINQLKSQQAETDTISQNIPVTPDQIQTQYGDTPESVMSDVELLGDDFTIDLRDDKKKTNALNNPNYNAVQKPDGSVEIIGMKHPTTGEWVGKKPNAVSIDENAHQAATSFQNNTPEPTQAQIEAGNYKKGHIKVQGLDISIENPKGSERRGTDPNGKAWAHAMSDHYGYIKRTKGADNEHIDTYIGHNPDSNQVFIVDQIDQASGNFDEHKVMLGFNNQEEAITAYKSNFDKGWKVGPIRNMDMGQFKDWLKNGDTSKPSSPQNLKESIENIRAEKIRQKTINDLHSGVYGKATDEQLQESLKHLNKEIAKAQKQSENEVVNGKRSTRKAVASGALDRFLKNRVDLETYIKARKNGEIKQRNDGTNDYSRNKLKPDEDRKGTSPLDTTFNALSIVSATRRVLSILEHLKLPTAQDTSSSDRIVVGNYRVSGFSVQIISSFADLPKVIQNDATYQDENGKTQNYDVSGVWHDGTLYVVADQVYGDSSKQLTTFDAYEELLVHEIIGRLGVQKLFGQEYKTKFQQLFNALGGMKGIRKIAQDNGVDMQQFESAYVQPYTQGVKDEIYTESDVQQALVSELFAFVAQNAKSKPFVRQKLKEVLGYIRQWFRDRGFDKFLSRYNDADLMMFLAEARKAVVDQKYFGKFKDQKIANNKNDSDQPLYSRSRENSTGINVQQVRDVLVDRFGKDTINELERQGKLEIIQDYQVDGVEGFYYNGKAVLVASNLTKESAVPTFLHELGGHAGFQNMMNQKQYQGLMSQFDKLVEQGNPVAMAAKVLAEREQGKNRQQLEYLPYLLTLSSTMQQRNVIQRNALQKLINNIVSFVKAWAFDKFGINLNLNPDDILVLSERMVNQLKEQSSLDAVRQKYHGTSQWMTAPNGAKTQLSEQQWLQVRTPEFKKWFGDWENDAKNASQVLDENGEPKVVYHGTASEFNEFKQGHGILGDGIYLTDSFDTADMYANIRGNNGFVLPLFVNIRNAFKTTENISRDKIVEATSSGKYQGVVHHFDNQEFIVALEPNQVKMAEGNTGTFNSESADIRFSRSAKESIDNLSKNLKNISVKSIKDKTAYKFTDWLGIGLSTLGRRQLTEIYSKLLPQLNKYNELAAQMDADKNDAGAEADEIVREWANLKDENQLADLMHDATLAMIDPAKPYVPGDNKIKYQQLRADFNSLSPETQAMYIKARDSYKKHYAKVQFAIKERILRASLSSQKKADLIKQMDQQFYGYVKGVYFPLARFGKYVVVSRNTTGQVESVSRAETMGEAQKIRLEMMKKFPQWKIDPVIQDKEFRSSRDAVGRGFMSNLFAEVDNLGLSTAEQAAFEDTLNQLYLSSMPDLSWAKHGIHRKGTAGFSQDARRAYAQNMFSGANYLAKLRYGDQLADQLDAMQKYSDEQIKQDHRYNQSAAQSVIDEMNKRHENLMNPKGHPLSSSLTSLGFIYYLGLSPAAAMVNLSQTALVAYPIMGARWGFDKAGKELLKASNDFRKGVDFHKVKWEGSKTDLYKTMSADISKFLSKDEKQAYDEAVARGVIDVTQAHDLAGIAQGEDSGIMWKTRPIMRAASVLFHNAERFNREVTFIASYRLARQAGVNHDLAFDQAVDATYKGHFDYSSGNRPRIMQGNVAKVLLLFKQFGQNMVYTLARQTYQSIKGETDAERNEARKSLAAILAMHATFAGVLGLPLVGMLLSVVSWAGGDDDDPWDAEIALRNYLAEAFNPTISNLLMKGAPRALTPIDLSGRVGINNMLLPDVQEGLEGKKWAESAMSGALGPVAGIGLNVAKGTQEISEGHNLRGLETMLPVFLKNFAKTYRYGEEGVQDKTGVSIMDEVNSMDLLVQGMGFSPSDVRTANEGKSAIYQLDKKLNARRGRLMTLWTRAKMMDDQQEMDEIWTEIQGFNDKNPSRRITRMNLNQSYKNRQRRIDRAEDGIYLSRNRQDARSAGNFAFGE
ncbi:PLxRFG domain-containing protein [Acinetobacter wuhouensis]|uniref:PLxRFG domain-containing protein n=1 Tax=Acinetobacter wuhouensis TaxID=1879050 RepID=A0A3G2T2B8_9GAMM|nr:PLxRFG domain-containing protein [Acinetobacter wuhouensis]AYO54379.1 PLxRFG domain-containing protein [Acinetobacter wuhouensis]